MSDGGISGIFDNRATMCREWWTDGNVRQHISAHVIENKTLPQYVQRYGGSRRWGEYCDVPREDGERPACSQRSVA